MTPNLDRLFAQATKRKWKVGKNGQIIMRNSGDFAHVAHLEWEGVPYINAKADASLIVLLANHGEALVKALEQIVRDQENPRVVAMTSIYDAKQLLAAIERDAKEGL